MATRCGTNKLLRPTLTELKPGAKLYTREGQRVTVIAEHTNDGEVIVDHVDVSSFNLPNHQSPLGVTD